MRCISEIRSFFLAGLVCLCVCGCTFTGKLYSLDSYTETVSSILITTDGGKLAVLTPRFHYIFDAPQSLVSIMRSGLSNSVKAEFSEFVVDNNNRITGTIALTVQLADLSIEQRKQANNAGFTRSVGWEMLAKIELSGTRYESGGLVTGVKKHKLASTYQITVKDTTTDTVGKALLTPITLAADGVLNLGRIALFPFALVIIGASGP